MRNVVVTIVALVIGLILAANVLPDVVTDAASDAYSEPFSVSTGAGETNTTETLSYEHYYGDLTELSATSNNENDTPVVLSYDEDTYDTTVGGLEASASRILTINYVREANLQFTGMSTLIRMTPMFCILGLIFASIWGFFVWRQSRG